MKIKKIIFGIIIVSSLVACSNSNNKHQFNNSEKLTVINNLDKNEDDIIIKNKVKELKKSKKTFLLISNIMKIKEIKNCNEIEFTCDFLSYNKNIRTVDIRSLWHYKILKDDNLKKIEYIKEGKLNKEELCLNDKCFVKNKVYFN